eukprot:CAMPEP_0117444524 /NCGR_PEP_ID=MMETSP0759-20121206/5288_1 /TAXON_ID=63605 /ORGANISM="Percolomonas cosmopolitus, Strain WS" /LENGTH=1116 /DNA_ID=CAMNT_0005236599 /DNA_START=49 /DNA_END=3396 /DNA_ORIENTATION=-
MSYLRELVRIVTGPPKPTESYTSKKHSGFLIKEGSNFKTWKQRYFILNQNGYLFYFKSDNLKEGPLNYFQVDNLEWVIVKVKRKGPSESAPIVPNCIKITRSPPLFLYSDEEQEMNKWKKALTDVGCRMALTEKEKKLPIVFVYDMRKEKDNWKKIKSTLLDAVGKKIEIDIDWNSFAQNDIVPKKDGRVVKCVYEYLLYLAKAIEKSCKGGDIEREAFINGVYQSTIKVELDPSIAAETNSAVYYDVKLLDGALVLKSNDKNFWGNSHAVGKNLEDLYQFAGDQEVPLAIRKNIRDSNKYLAECLDIMKSISGGQNFSFEVDWKSLIYCDSIKRHQWDSMAQVVYKEYFLRVVQKAAKLTEDELVWKAFFEAVSQKKIALSVKKLESCYHATSIVGGVLHIYISTNGYYTNTGSVGNDLQKAIQNTGGDELPLDVRKNIKDEEEKRQALIERLKAVTSFDYDIIVDWTTIVASIPERNYPAVASQTYKDYLGNLVKRIEKICEDEMVRDAFVASTPARMIRFTMAPIEGAYNAVKLSSDGALILECKIDGGWQTNCPASGNKLEELLEFSGSTLQLPLKVRKSIRDSEKHKKDALAAFKSISGRDYQIDVDWEGLVRSESIDKSQWGKLAETVYKSYLLTLAKNISSLCKGQELVAESFTEHTHANRITFGMAPLQSGRYNSVTLADGVLVVSCAQGGWFTNVSNIGKNDLLDQLSDRDQEMSNLPLVLRVSVQENADKFEQALHTWRDFAGEDANIVIDWDSVSSHVERSNLKNVGRSLQGDVASSIVKNFKIIVGKTEKHMQSNKLRIAFKKLGASPFHLVQYNEEENRYELILNSVHYLTSVSNVGVKEIADLLVDEKQEPQPAEDSPAGTQMEKVDMTVTHQQDETEVATVEEAERTQDPSSQGNEISEQSNEAPAGEIAIADELWEETVEESQVEEPAAQESEETPTAGTSEETSTEEIPDTVPVQEETSVEETPTEEKTPQYEEEANTEETSEENPVPEGTVEETTVEEEESQDETHAEEEPTEETTQEAQESEEVCDRDTQVVNAAETSEENPVEETIAEEQKSQDEAPTEEESTEETELEEAQESEEVSDKGIEEADAEETPEENPV